ncbi:MAG: hypothetical protein KTR31_10230 [Myxococcales bacterium]|nr:hypothetical protein [Myxococcales bacterium]
MFLQDLGNTIVQSVTVARVRTVSSFFGEELVASGAGWTAGSLSAWLVSQFFVQRSWKNLWGLTATNRTALAQDDYQLLADVAGYVVGLVVLIVVRQLVVGTMAYLRLVREEREGPAESGEPADGVGAP